LAEGVLGGGRVGLGRVTVRHARAVPQRPHVLVLADPQELVDLDAPTLVERNAELAQQWVRPHTGRPDERSRRDARSVAAHGIVRRDRLECRADVNLDAAPFELPRGVLADAGWELGTDLGSRVGEDPPVRAPRDAGGAA